MSSYEDYSEASQSYDETRVGSEPNPRGSVIMISRLIDAVAPLLPVTISEVDYSDPVLLINGAGWSLRVLIAC